MIISLLVLLVATVVIVGTLVALSLVPCPPGHALVISGTVAGPRISTRASLFRIPLIERVDLIDLRSFAISAPWSPGLHVGVDTDPSGVHRAATRLLQLPRDELGRMVDELAAGAAAERGSDDERTARLDELLAPLGLRVVSRGADAG